MSLSNLVFVYHRVARRLKIGLKVLVIAGPILVVAVPNLREPVLLYLGGRDAFVSEPAIRKLAMKALAYHESDAVILELLYVSNALGPKFANRPWPDNELAEAAINAIAAATDSDFGSGRVDQRLDALNRWASERFDRPLDDNGGVLGWYTVLPRYNRFIEGIASADPYNAWVAWSFLGAENWTDLVIAIAPALSDPRPLSFAIRRGDFLTGPGPDKPSYSSQPEPIEEHGDAVLVRTVGEAIALKFWDRAPDREGDEFPDDFQAWWAIFARSQHLPALPVQEKSGS